MLKWILNITQNWGMVYSDSEQGQVTGSCEHDNGSPGSIKGGEYVDQVREFFLCSMELI
jgi:hypothetical protein